MKAITKYVCSYCGEEYKTNKEFLDCEAAHLLAKDHDACLINQVRTYLDALTLLTGEQHFLILVPKDDDEYEYYVTIATNSIKERYQKSKYISVYKALQTEELFCNSNGMVQISEEVLFRFSINQSDRLQKVLKKKLHSCRESELVAIAMLLKVDL